MSTTRTRLLGLACALAAAASCAACGGGSPSPRTTTTTTASVRDLPATAATRAALLAAGATAHGLSVGDFTGLAAGRTFYAFDIATRTSWAGAELVPSHTSMQAQVDVQDDGAYDVFVRHPGGRWTAYEDGLGTQPGTRCTIVVPASVRAVWGWSTTTPCGGPPGS